MKKQITMLGAVASTFVISLLAVSMMAPQEAFASHNGEPTMWVNGINDGQTHSYIYNVPAGNLGMSVLLVIIKENKSLHNPHMNLTPNVQYVEIIR